MADADIQEKLEKQFKILRDADTPSLLRKYLTPEVFDQIKEKRTKLGGNLTLCINSGIEQLDAEIGFRACDPDAYETFRPLFDPTIKHYHGIPQDQPVKHPAPDFGDVKNLPFGNLDPENKYIISTRVRVGRNVSGYPFQMSLTKDKRAEIESKMTTALQNMPEEYKGTYHSLEKMTEEEQQKMIDDHYLYNHSNRYTRSAGAYRDFPCNRGIHFSHDKKFIVWCCETDHFRLISLQNGGDLAEVYRRLVKGIELISAQIDFAHSDRLGFLSFCPTNLGTTLRASVHIRIPKLAAHKEALDELCKKYNLQVRGIHGDATEIFGTVFDVSNRRRLGLTEIEAITEMAEGVTAMIEKESSL